MSGGYEWIDVVQEKMKFGELDYHTHFYLAGVKWGRVGKNLALSDRNEIKWFDDEAEIFIVMFRE